MLLACSHCKQEKPVTDFYKNKSRITGYHNQCKSCFSLYYEANKSWLVAYRVENKRKNAAKHVGRGLRKYAAPVKDYFEATGLIRCARCAIEKPAIDNFYKSSDSSTGFQTRCKKCCSLVRRCYYEENRLKLLASDKKYRDKNKAQLSRKANERRKNSVQNHLAQNLRRRLRSAMKKGARTGSAVRDLGCSVSFLKQHLELSFLDGMAWNNYGHGKGKWTIDHIMPLNRFDLTNKQHVMLACNYMNLQPLWFEDNMRKSDNI